MQSITEQSSMDALKQEIDIASRASMGIIAIRCPITEVYRVVETIYAASSSNGSFFRLWTGLSGWQQFDSEYSENLVGGEPIESDQRLFNPITPISEDRATIMYAQALQKITDDGRDMLQYPDDCYYVLIDAHHYFTEPMMEASFRKQAQRVYNSDQRLFVVIPDTAEIPDNIAPFLHLIEYEYPKRGELLQILDLMVESLEDEHKPDLSDEQKYTICQNGLGMSKTAFESALALSITDWNQDEADDERTPVSFEHICEWMRKYKTEALRKTEVLEIQESIGVNEIGGLDNYKDWMNTRKVTYSPEAVKRGITPSKGVLVVGPPGTGKSLVAKAAGAQLGLPVIRFDVGRVFGAFVGQSEGRMRSVLKMLDAMAPLVLMVDEIDKGFAGTGRGGSNDGGTSMRVFGTFLTWMQERDQIDKPVFIVFTANRVSGLPSELLRKGRLDEIWSINPPNPEEREEIIKIHAKKRKLSVSAESRRSLVSHSEGLVGAEIEALVEQCLIRAFADKSDELTIKHFMRERQHLKPLKESFADDFAEMEEWGKKNARPASSEISKAPSPVKRISTRQRTTIRKKPTLN